MVSEELKKLIERQEMDEMARLAQQMTQQSAAAMEGDPQALEWVKNWIRPFATRQTDQVPFPVLMRVAAAYFVGHEQSGSASTQAIASVDAPPPAEPPEYPDELVAANIAYRTVAAGYGDPSDTFRNRLIHYLKKHWPGLGQEAVDRIATIANPDKSRGRKKPNA